MLKSDYLKIQVHDECSRHTVSMFGTAYLEQLGRLQTAATTREHKLRVMPLRVKLLLYSTAPSIFPPVPGTNVSFAFDAPKCEKETVVGINTFDL